MAAVGAVYTIEPFVRTADDVIEEVMRKKARERRPRPQNKRVRAELLVGKVALFLWLADGCGRASAKDFHEIRAVFTRGWLESLPGSARGY